MAIKIYTKTGDKGTTSLIGGVKVSKSDLRIDSYGTVDELNAHIGLVHDLITDAQLQAQLIYVQDRLFTIGSLLACAPGKADSFQLPVIHLADVTMLEAWIDEMDAQLEKLTNFILPGGHTTVSQIHIARCVCRRAERTIVQLFAAESSSANDLIIMYLNRLSDHLFVLSRLVAQQLGVKPRIWQPAK